MRRDLRQRAAHVVGFCLQLTDLLLLTKRLSPLRGSINSQGIGTPEKTRPIKGRALLAGLAASTLLATLAALATLLATLSWFLLAALTALATLSWFLLAALTALAALAWFLLSALAALLTALILLISHCRHPFAIAP